MPGLLPDVDPDGLLEFSVVFTDRSLNHMSVKFQQVMNDISSTMKQVYHASSVAIVPGGGTYGMEAVARQFATGEDCLVIRNGFFSYRWTQIFEAGQMPSSHTALLARRINNEPYAPFAPVPSDEVCKKIRSDKPGMVFAPHVETASGIILPDDYIREVAAATHEVGGLFVLDCIASGAMWVDMDSLGVDVLISAPQKGWSSTPCSAIVMMSELSRKRIDDTTSTSFAADLKKWLQIMETYESGGHAYHATMPTDSLTTFRDNMLESEKVGFDVLRSQQAELGQKVRALLAEKGLHSVAAPGFEAPGVVVCYTDDSNIQTGKAFLEAGLQIAAGVPLQCDEGDNYQSFRLGLFGLEKLENIDRTVDTLADALDKVM